uniref:N-acetyltransferase domain-containing protein n=1 Tax=Eutreptiella gymnastica TaxID=73025 RepID=A0A6U7TJL9_9EUGL
MADVCPYRSRDHSFLLFVVQNPSQLAHDVQQRIFRTGGLQVAMGAFGETADTVTPASSESHFHHMFAGDVLLLAVCEDTGHQVSHALFNYYLLPNAASADTTVTYLNGVAVLPRWQGQGLFSALLHTILCHRRTLYLACRTQNPRIVAGLQKVGTVYPLVHPSQEVMKIAAELAAQLGHTPSNGYDPDSMVAKKWYPHFIINSTPWPDNSDCGKRMSQLLDQKAGDCLISICIPFDIQP